MDPLLDFSGKAVLITGAAQGFGRLLAEAVAARGGRLVLGDINDAGVQGVADRLKAQGAEVVAMRCDVSREADVKALVDAAVDAFGRLDIAVNNAGISQPFLPLDQTDESMMDLQFAVNVKGVQFGMKHQIRQMKQQTEGVILNVSSMAGIAGAPKIAAYSAAKHAVIGLTKTGAVEVAAQNIRINAVCPFFTLTAMVADSDLVQNSSLEEVSTKLSRGAPMRRLGEPQEIVDVMLLLLSPRNTYMTGQVIAVDGGRSAS